MGDNIKAQSDGLGFCFQAAKKTPNPPLRRIRFGTLQAGLLACGSSAHGAFPVSQWHTARASPLTVAGAAADFHRFPFSSGDPDT